MKALTEAGVKEIAKKDYFSDPFAWRELADLRVSLGIPPVLQGHLVTVIDGGRVILEGHVPRAVVEDLLRGRWSFPFKRVLIFQDEMGRAPRTYKVWLFRGDAQEFPIETPIRVALQTLQARGPSAEGPTREGLLLATVLLAGLLDGLSPCAFAVLLFLVAFLFAIRRARGDVLKTGGAFVASVYISYFLIGLGLLRAFALAGQPHLIGKLGAFLLILLGLAGLYNVVVPSFPLRLTMSAGSWEVIRRWIHRATLPSAAIAGFLVGFCTLPCSGGIYVATLGLLTKAEMMLQGLGYLALYNAANIVPLVAILFSVGNRPVSLKLTQWERGSARHVRVAFALTEVLLGVAMLIWLV